MADLQNALALSEPKERPLKMAQRNDQGNGKKPFWSSKVHGIPQGYNTNRPSTVPPHPQQTGALATRPKSANQAALDRRDGRLVERDKESAASLVPLEVLAQIENSLKTAVVQCCPEYEKKQTILLRAFQTFDQAGRGTIPLDAFRKALACFQIETSEAEVTLTLPPTLTLTPPLTLTLTLTPTLTLIPTLTLTLTLTRAERSSPSMARRSRGRCRTRSSSWLTNSTPYPNPYPYPSSSP